MNIITIFQILFLFSPLVYSLEYPVYEERDLLIGLALANPGDSITLLRNDSSTLILRGEYDIYRNGNASHPITIKGHPQVHFSNPDGNSFHHFGSYWEFSGLIFLDSWNGIYLQTAYNNRFTGLIFNQTWTPINLLMSSGNHFKNTTIIHPRMGIHMAGAFRNTFDGGFISSGDYNYSGNYGINIAIDCDENIVQNMKFQVNENTFFYINSPTDGPHYGNIIKNNEFWLNGDESSSVIRIYNDRGGRFEGNRIISSTDVTSPLITVIQSIDYTFQENIISTHSTRPNIIFELDDSMSTGVKFYGNQMEFHEENPDNLCIFGDPEFHSGNVIISEDNTCINGEITNIF